MGLRVRKSITLCKGVRVNLGRSGASLSFGTKGLRQTIHTSGRRTTSVGIPGTGMSYSFSSKSKKHQQQKLNEKNKNDSAQVQQYQDLINDLKTIHVECDEVIDWVHIYSLEEPYDHAGIGQRQANAIEAYDQYKPNFFASIFRPFVKRKKYELERMIEQAALEDKAEYDEWQKLNELSRRVLDGDIDAYFEVINEMNPFDDLLEYCSGFELGADDKTTMEVEFQVKSIEMIPDYSLSLTKTGKLSRKDLTKTAYFELVQDYVCSSALRIARDLFALLPLEKVIVHATDNVINNTTGHSEDITILSVVFERNSIDTLNMEKIDPSDAMGNFEHNMKFLKTGGFKPVDRI